MNKAIPSLKRLILLIAIAIALIGIALPSGLQAASASPTPESGEMCGLTLLGKKDIDTTKYERRILGWVPKGDIKEQGDALEVYLQSLHNQVMPYVFVASVIYVIFSGIQYMISGYSPGLEKEAKQRIIGVVSGILFYVIMITLYNWFMCDVATI